MKRLNGPTRRWHLSATIAFACLALAAGTLAAPGTAGADERDATAVVRAFGEGTIALAAAEGRGGDAREASFGDLVARHFDLPLIGRIVLGPAWRAASEAERAEYLALFEEFIIKSYFARLAAYDGEALRVDGSRAEGERDVVVRTRIESPQRPPVRVDWRLRDGEAGFRIIDVVVEGLSLAITHRSEFGAVLAGRGSLARLLEVLRERNAQLTVVSSG